MAGWTAMSRALDWQAVTVGIALTGAVLPRPVLAQLSSGNASGVAMGHLHYHVHDVEANKRFWVALGGTPTTVGGTEAVQFPDVLVLLEPGDSTGGTEGSVVNHVAFRVASIDPLEEAGFDVQHLAQFPGVASVHTPEGERIELFDDGRATNLGFTQDPGHADPVAERHNRPLRTTIIAHHIHLYVPEGQVGAAKAWYQNTFGGTPGQRWRYEAVDLPGINLNFSETTETLAPTHGRMLDHVGFEVRGLEAFCERLERQDVVFDEPYARRADGLGIAVLTDPWGTRIALTEGLEQLASH